MEEPGSLERRESPTNIVHDAFLLSGKYYSAACKVMPTVRGLPSPLLLQHGTCHILSR